ncbi:ABC transporter permease [bacterium]|nr:ABC transporter permease [bacterium]
MPYLEVAFLVFWMEFSWAIRMKLYIAYIAIPPFFYLITYAIQHFGGVYSPFDFLWGAVASAYLLTSFIISLGFVQRGKSFWNLSKLAGSPPIYIYCGELSFSAFVSLGQSLIFFYLIRVGTGVGGLGSFILFLLFTMIFSLLFTSIFLLLSRLVKFNLAKFFYLAIGLFILLLIFSNLFIPINSLPFPIRLLAFLNPLTYGVSGISKIFTPKGDLPSLGLPLIFGIYIALSALSLYLLSKQERQ